MKKKLKIVLIVFTSLVALIFALNKTGICAFYHVPTISSEPNIKHGAFIAVSNMITPQKGDFITYMSNDSLFGNIPKIHRLCGMENDTIQLIAGELFVNGKNFDKNYNLRHAYLLDQNQFEALHDSTIDYYVIAQENGEKAFLTFVDEADAHNLKFEEKRYRNLKTIPNPEIQKIFQQPWNKDHFGPFVIPEGKLFVLGDNRDQSIDSRFLGCINRTDITGVYWKTLFVWK